MYYLVSDGDEAGIWKGDVQIISAYFLVHKGYDWYNILRYTDNALQKFAQRLEVYDN